MRILNLGFEFHAEDFRLFKSLESPIDPLGFSKRWLVSLGAPLLRVALRCFTAPSSTLSDQNTAVHDDR